MWEHVPLQQALMYPLLPVNLHLRKVMEIKYNTSASVAESSSRVIADSFLWSGCVAIAKVMSKSSAPRACIALSAHHLAWAAEPWHSLGWSHSAQCWGTFRAVPPSPGPAGSSLWLRAAVVREIWPGCTHLDSNAAGPSPGPQAFAVSLWHVALKPWWKPALLRSVAKFPVTLMRPGFQPGKLFSSAILTAVAQLAKRCKTLCDFPLRVPSSPAN